MSKRAALIAILVGVGVAGALAFWPGREPPVQEIIQRNVLSMARSAESRDLGGVMEHVSDRFRGKGMNRDELNRFLAGQILTGRWVKVFVRGMEVDLVAEGKARFRGRFVFGRAEGDTFEQLARDGQIQAWEVSGDVEREADGKWRFVTGDYNAIPANQLL